ncbi:MAG TPA: aldolase/citrate lyase family protein [Nitrolancea sp.]|nr:aldolase/citrate lyase family protein [Nitrolancea sp.]
MRPNLVRQKLQAGEVVIGCFVGFPSPEVVELCGHSGYDFVLIDAEHGAITPASAYHMVLAAEASGTVPLIRVPHNEPSIILRYLDIGAAGVMVPQVNSAAEARAVVEAVKYHPHGKRGLAPTRAASYGFGATLTEYTEISNRETIVIAQMENIVGVENVPEIIEVPGIDVLLIGPSDLAQSMGYPGQLGHPEVLATIARIRDMCKGSAVALGTIAADAATTNQLIEQGFRVITPSASGLIAQWSRNYLADIKR